MTLLTGTCHCGALRAQFETADPEALQVRACQCGFCRRHGARTVSDPAGHLRFSFSEAATSRYRFGTGSGDFLICRGCGAYMGVVMDSVGVLNVAAADIGSLASKPAEPMVYDDEAADAKRLRRLERWTPVTVEARP
ncbi:MAG TPA: aldehyde-activating protein [Caulobacteraceae bacterium]|nr:aldehyde-activating protein [Caulobacteraceae bacterium]